MITIDVNAALDGERIDRVVAMLAGCSRSAASDLISGACVRIAGRPVTARSARVAEGDLVELDWDGPLVTPPVEPDPTIAVPVVHADDHVIVVDKPSGLTVHPGAGTPVGTLVHGLLAQYPEIGAVGEPDRPGIVHRLDKDTSGLLVVARSEEAYESLTAQLADRSVGRSYETLVWGHFESGSGVIDAPIGRSARAPTRMAVSSRGKDARTGYEVMWAFSHPVPTTRLRCRLETGRTHQIRVHLAAIDHPVVGDARYGGARAPLADLPRFFLHAQSLAFDHPVTGDRLDFESPLPADLAEVLARLS